MATVSETIISAAVGSAMTLLLTKGMPWLLNVYKNRYVQPKKAHQQFLSQQAQWFQDRAEKLRALDWQLANEPSADKFQLALLASKLDRRDQDWARKIITVEEMRKAAVSHADMCEENASETFRMMDWVNTHSLLE